MKIYDCAGLQRLLGIGRDRAYQIMRDYGFRVGDRASRISEPQLKRYIERGNNNDGKRRYKTL